MIKPMRYFQAVVRYKNFTEAAEECFISQSAISQQIQALEKELGVQLLIREKRKFSLTAAGENFYKKSLILVNDYDRICEETKRLAKGVEQILTVGYPRQYSGSEIQQVIPEFQQKYPDIPLHLISGTHEELYELLRDGKANIVINDIRRQPSEFYVNYFLMREKIFVSLPANSPLMALESLSADDLKNTPCILITPEEQQEIEELFYREYFGIQSDFLRAENMEQAVLLVVSGRGFCLTEVRDNQPEKLNATRQIPFVAGDKQFTQDYYAFWPVKRTEAYIEDFAAMLEGQLAQISLDHSKK